MTQNNEELLKAIKLLVPKHQDTKAEELWNMVMKIGMFILLGAIAFIGNNSIETKTAITVMATKQDQIIKSQEANTEKLKEERFTQNNYNTQTQPLISGMLTLTEKLDELEKHDKLQDNNIQKLQLELELIKNNRK